MSDDKLSFRQNECYGPGYGAELVKSYQKRTSTKEAAFFTQHLRPGMALLDCGCGPGTITIGLAKVIAPGTATGIDIQPSQIEAAKDQSLSQRVFNIQFQVSSVYELPFDDASFDAVFAHALLQHLRYPQKALQEINRVLKPGGVVGVRDDDQGGFILAPQSPKMERLIELLNRFIRHNGGNPWVGRLHRQLLREAGFNSIIASANCEYDGTIDETVIRGNLASKLVEQMTETIIQQGWATIREMKELEMEAKNWGKNPDAFDAIIWCEAVGWKA